VRRGAKTLCRVGTWLREPEEVLRRLAPYGYTACYVNSEGALVEAGDCRGELPDYNFVFQR
jgi:hypothetical protein